MTSYLLDGDAVVMVTKDGPVRLTHMMRERLLDIYQEAEAAKAFNSLHDAHVAAGGVPRHSERRAA